LIRRESGFMAEPSATAAFDVAAFDCPIIQVDGWDATMPRLEAEFGGVFGAALPQAVGEMVCRCDLHAIRIAPRRFWLLCGAEPPTIDIDPELGCSCILARAGCGCAFPAHGSRTSWSDASQSTGTC
jgi:sarcosine oxidase subunit gamma